MDVDYTARGGAEPSPIALGTSRKRHSAERSKTWSECPQASGGGAAVIDTARGSRGLCYWPLASPSRNAEGRYSCETLTR